MLQTRLMLLLLSLGSISAYAQVPGYLGKKITLQGEFHSFPAINGPTATFKGSQFSYGENAGEFGFNWSAGVRLGYVVSRYNQILLSFDYLKTGMTQTAYFPSDFDYSSRDLFLNLKGLSFGIGTRKFRTGKGGLAPMGLYNGFSLNATLLKGEINKDFNPPNIKLSTYGIDAKHMLVSLGYEFGNNFIIKDRLLLNVGAKLNFALSPRAFKNAIEASEPWDPYNNVSLSLEEGNTDNFKTEAASRYAFHSIFMIYLGVGLIQ